MLLAAGLGTRLRPLTEELPKPLVPVGDRAAILHVLERVRAAEGSRGAGPVVVNAHHKADALAAALAPYGVSVSHEAELLGTAGGVSAASALLGAGDVLVWNADILADVDVGALAAAHADRDAAATLVVTGPKDVGAKGRGNVGLAADGRVVRLRNETFGPGEVRGADFVGIHLLGASLRSALPGNGCLVGDVYIPRGRAGARIFAVPYEGPFVDIGTVASYAAANFDWLVRCGRPSLIEGEIGPDVEVGEAVIVGPGARIDGRGAVSRVVVWPGAVARAPLSDAIVTPKAVVSLGPVAQSPSA